MSPEERARGGEGGRDWGPKRGAPHISQGRTKSRRPGGRSERGPRGRCPSRRGGRSVRKARRGRNRRPRTSSPRNAGEHEGKDVGASPGLPGGTEPPTARVCTCGVCVCVCVRAGAGFRVWAAQPPTCRSGPGPSACQPWPTVQHPEQAHPSSLALQSPEPWARAEDTWPAPGLAGGKHFSRLRLETGAALAGWAWFPVGRGGPPQALQLGAWAGVWVRGLGEAPPLQKTSTEPAVE